MLRNKGQVSYTEKGDTLIVSIGGEIDHHSAVSVRTGIDQKLMEIRHCVLHHLEGINSWTGCALNSIS